MAQFDNPFEDKPTSAKPIPGVVAQQYADMIAMGFRWIGCPLYPHERDGLAQFLGAPLRKWPKLLDMGKKG